MPGSPGGTGLASEEAGMTSRARRGRIVSSESLVAGIDVAKGRHVAVLRARGGFKTDAFGFTNDRSGFESLTQRAEATRRELGCSSIVFALESTGHYGHALR